MNAVSQIKMETHNRKHESNYINLSPLSSFLSVTVGSFFNVVFTTCFKCKLGIITQIRYVHRPNNTKT